MAAGQGARQQDADRLDAYTPPVPKFIGRRVFKNFDLAELAKYIDWGPFFQTWDLAGPFPADPHRRGRRRRRAKQSLCRRPGACWELIEGRWLTANGVIGLYPANTVNDDDIEIYTDETRSEVAMTWYGLRQQTEKQVIDGVMRPSRCLADFVIAPKGRAGAQADRTTSACSR